jgi:hypothetical protein
MVIFYILLLINFVFQFYNSSFCFSFFILNLIIILLIAFFLFDSFFYLFFFSISPFNIEFVKNEAL